MSNTHNPNRLHKQLSNMISLEAAIEQKLEQLVPAVSAHAGVTALLTGLLAMPRMHRQALAVRLAAIADGVPVSPDTTRIFPQEVLSQGVDYPVSTALQEVYTMFHQAVFGYAELHSLATRFLDSPYTASGGTAYHLTRQHTQDYIQSIQQISRLIHDVVLWELDEEDCECQCVCLSCGVGICLCAQAGRAFLSNTWAEAGPIAADEVVIVQRPKEHSPAAKAGLLKGDVILGANRVEFKSFWDIFDVLENTKSGEEILWMVRRESGLVEEIAMDRSAN